MIDENTYNRRSVRRKLPSCKEDAVEDGKPKSRFYMNRANMVQRLNLSIKSYNYPGST